MSHALQKELDVLLNAMRLAGEVILTVQKQGFSIQRKMNNDILTQADVEANEVLKRELLGAFPQDGWLSEESVDHHDRLSCDRVWIVDPIDGTKEFAQGIPEYAISVALVEQGIPCLASVYNPSTGELYHAIKDHGAWSGNQRLACHNEVPERFALLASRSEVDRGEWNGFAANHDVRMIGSIAYKLALIAAGKADATFSLGNKNEWDIAAGVLLVQEAGGIVGNKRGQAFVFNQKNVLVDGIVASSAAINAKIHQVILETTN